MSARAAELAAAATEAMKRKGVVPDTAPGRGPRGGAPAAAAGGSVTLTDAAAGAGGGDAGRAAGGGLAAAAAAVQQQEEANRRQVEEEEQEAQEKGRSEHSPLFVMFVSNGMFWLVPFLLQFGLAKAIGSGIFDNGRLTEYYFE
jgi:hypothetical protein